MHKIDGAGHLGNMFVAEDPLLNRAPTEITAEWLNAVQIELASVIEWAGFALAKNNNGQLLQALQAKFASLAPEGDYAMKLAVQTDSYKAAAADVVGAPDAIVAEFFPDITSLVSAHGMTLYVRALAANATETPTFTPNNGTIAHKTIVKGNNLPLAAGDIAGDGYWMELRYDLTLDKWVLMNPAKGISPVDLPIDVIYVPYATPPTGYLKANGAEVNRTTYANLFSKIGTTFGIGDGASTFNLPDLRGEFIRCWDDGRGIDSGRGLGTYQRGTLEQRDLDGVLGLSQHSGPSPSEPDTNRDSIGLDAPVLADYPGDPFSNLHGPSGVNYTLSANTSSFGVMRPRNISLLACIKY